MVRGESKESILNFIIKNPRTYVNEIVKKLSMSKTTVSRDVRELLQEKRIIPFSDSCNQEYKKDEKPMIKKRRQLVYFNKIEERIKSDNVSDPMVILPQGRASDELQNIKNLRNSFRNHNESLQRIITDFKNSSEDEKRVKIPFLKYALNVCAKLEVQKEKLDRRKKYTEMEKILASYSIADRFTIRQFAKLEKVSTKQISKISKQYPVSKEDPRYPEFKKMIGDCSNCGHSVADGLIEKISQ